MSITTEIELTSADDFHTHLRDSDVLQHTVVAVCIM